MHPRQRLLLALLALLALTQVGCSLGGPPEREALPVPEQHQKENDAAKSDNGKAK